MRILVFQHVDCEHPGSLRQFLAEDEIEWDPVYLHRGDKIPSFENYDALWVMGGPMDVWDCLLYTSPSPRDRQKSRMPSSA